VSKANEEESTEDSTAATPPLSDHASSGSAPMDTDAAGPAAADEHTKFDKKFKTKKYAVPCKAVKVAGFSKIQLDEFFEKECQLQAADNLQEETNVKKNALEAYIYSLRNKMHESLAPYIKESDKDVLASTLQEVEGWLYDEGEDSTKSVYMSKLEELKKIWGPIESRYDQDQQRGPAAQALRKAAETYLAFSKSDSVGFAHVTPAERQVVAQEAETVIKWLCEKEALQASREKWAEPALLTHDILKKKDTLERICKPIASKPLPKTPAPFKTEDTATPADASQNDAAPMDVENILELSGQGQNMDADK